MLTSAAHRAISSPEQMNWVEALMLAFAFAIAGSVAIAGLYLVKSALGMNLMPGPSPLHDLLYPLIRG